MHSHQQSTEALYKPYRKHPRLFEGQFLETWLAPEFVELAQTFKEERKGKEAMGADGWKKASPHLKEEAPEVYSFRCLSPEFIRLFEEEIANFYHISDKHRIPVRRPNSMNNYGVVINEIGMRPLVTDLQQRFIWPVARRLFPKQAEMFDSHHSFIVRYQQGEDLGLDMHIDDSDVTFNVCVGEKFTGATLSFCGNFGEPTHRKFTYRYKHEIGRAVLHLGTRRHGADDIETGSRMNLIVWSHNSKWRGSQEYRQRRQALYEREGGPPSYECLSYTHDRDYRAFRDLPKSKERMHFHPWCPPPGKEYEGFLEAVNNSPGSRNRREEL